MGYYTHYEISIEFGEPTEHDMDALTKEFERCGLSERYGDNWYDDAIKWYDYELDMFNISKQFPNYQFLVCGNGEDAYDIWEDHWKDGRLQRCVMEIPPFDPMQMRKMTIVEVDGCRFLRCETP